MHYDNTDEHFKNFTHLVEGAIAKYGDLSEETVLDRQRRQVETLVALELEFKTKLCAHEVGPAVYDDFVKYIVDEKRNILAARPYFRERQTCFTEFISGYLKDRNSNDLKGFRINYPFVKFAKGRLLARSPFLPETLELLSIVDKIEKLRIEIVEMNLPLAISRARLFWSRTPKAQLSYMDLVQISCEGLIAAVDKFVPPFAKVFRAVAIGRITGNFIEQYSETLIHFYPSDRRKLYRANKLAGKRAAIDFELLAEQINSVSDPTNQTTPSEIAELMSAAGCVSTESSASADHDIGSYSDRCSADDCFRPDIQCEQAEAIKVMSEAIKKLSVFEQKLLALKGIAL